MSSIKNFVESEVRKTKVLALALREDPISTGLGVGIQLLSFGIGMWFIIQATKWAYTIVSSAI
jgi:hypothetical protein